MIAELVSKTPKAILEKLNQLLATLHRVKKTLEQSASTIHNQQIRYTVLGLAQESKQYANELMSHIEILGGEREKFSVDQEFIFCEESEEDAWKCSEEKDRLKICTTSEKSLLQVYREVLNEPFLYENIRKMIRYQLNGILHSFAQLKLLNASLRKE
ncbi:MAG: hypothetical protein JST75_10730 [Bacteroidetes bacterium]|nr:hypothetical protein [Bacteroidota bacterium]